MTAAEEGGLPHPRAAGSSLLFDARGRAAGGGQDAVYRVSPA